MTRTEQLQARWQAAMMPNYGTPPVAIDHGDGVHVWDVDGRRYLDFVGGIAVSALGHAHPAIVDAVTHQVARVAHTSNLSMHEPGIVLAERLLALFDRPGRVFFANSGAEANECAIKLTRLHGRALDPSGHRVEIVATEGGFHGRTVGALSLTGTPSKREPFTPLPGPVRFVPFGERAALRAAVGPQTAAVFLEATQGEGGVVPAPPGYLALARELCDDAGALLVIDEVQSGIGRTGEWLAGEAAGVRADIVTLAKGLGGGLPIGVCVGLGPVGELFAPGLHGSTFGGNPIAAAAALAVLDTIEKDGLLESVRTVGRHLNESLAAIDDPLIASVRGTGLWLGVVLTEPIATTVEANARRGGLLVNAVRPDVIRLAPPLITTGAHVDEAVPILAESIAAVRSGAG